VNALRKDQINIDHYMSDLRRHALEEYNELYLRETSQQCQSTQANCADFYESKNKKKKNRKK
jgi:hypothetical protein